MLAAVNCVKNTIAKKRTEDSFQRVYNKATEMCNSLNLSPIEMPRARKSPKRLSGQGSAHVPSSSPDFFRTEFFKVLDVVNMQFQERFEQEGLLTISSIEKVLLTGESDAGLLEQYPELHCTSLRVQLAMFKSKYDYQSTTEAASTLRNMLPEVRQLFDQVETLVRLLLVCPVSSAEAERSLSFLRRLKTWLRSTMTQSHLNNVAVCHIHSDKLDSIDREMIA